MFYIIYNSRDFKTVAFWSGAAWTFEAEYAELYSSLAAAKAERTDHLEPYCQIAPASNFVDLDD